jgi:hypothetical protein
MERIKKEFINLKENSILEATLEWERYKIYKERKDLSGIGDLSRFGKQIFKSYQIDVEGKSVDKLSNFASELSVIEEDLKEIYKQDSIIKIDILNSTLVSESMVLNLNVFIEKSFETFRYDYIREKFFEWVQNSMKNSGIRIKILEFTLAYCSGLMEPGITEEEFFNRFKSIEFKTQEKE